MSLVEGEPLRPRPPWRELGMLLSLVGYGATRAYYASLGMRSDTSTLGYFWQYQDLAELARDPIEAVLYQHTQPPLYNLLLAVAVRFDRPGPFFAVTGVLFGLVLTASLYALLRSLRVHPGLAVLTVWLAALEPASILMEHWVFYEHPVTALLVLSAALLARGVETSSRRSLFFAFLAMAAVVLTRSLFHLAWMILAVGLATALAQRRGRVLAMALVPLALAASVYVKNQIVFGHPFASSWLGFSVSRLVTTQAPREAVSALIAEGAVSELADDLPWLPLGHYPEARRALPAGLPEVPVLTQVTRSTGHPNFNHAAYVEIAQTFQRDARVIDARMPELWRRSTERAWVLFFFPIHDYTFFHAPRRRAGEGLRVIEQAYERLYGADAFAAWDWDAPMPPYRERPGWRWAKLVALALLVALGLALTDRRRGVRAALLFVVGTMLVVGVVGNSLELGENNRFRYLAQPFSWALLALALDRAARLFGVALRRARELRA